MDAEKKRILFTDYQNGVRRLERGFINRKQERAAERAAKKADKRGKKLN